MATRGLSKYLFFITLTALPFLVRDASGLSRAIYFIFWFMAFAALAFASLANTTDATSQSPEKVKRNKSWFPYSSSLLFLLVSLAIANAELFGLGLQSILKDAVSTASHALPTLEDQEMFYRRHIQTYPDSTFEALHILKTQSITVWAVVFSLAWLASAMFSLVSTQEEPWGRPITELEPGSPPLFESSLIVASVALLFLSAFWFAWPELDSTPPGRAWCFMVLKCYGTNSFLILLSGIWKVALIVPMTFFSFVSFYKWYKTK